MTYKVPLCKLGSVKILCFMRIFWHIFGGYAQLPNRQINPNVSSESGTMYNKNQTALSHSHIYHHIKLLYNNSRDISIDLT